MVAEDNSVKILVQHSLWNSELLASMSELRSSGMLCDTTLECCDGIAVRAHSCILAAASQRVKSLLSGAALGYYTLHMRDVTSTTWQHMMHFIYDGQVLLEPGDIDNVYEAAVRFEIVRLAEALTDCGAVKHRRVRKTRPTSSHYSKDDVIEICDDEVDDDKTNSSDNPKAHTKSMNDGNGQLMACSNLQNNKQTDDCGTGGTDKNTLQDAGGDCLRRKEDSVSIGIDNLFERLASSCVTDSTSTGASSSQSMVQTCSRNEVTSVDVSSAQSAVVMSSNNIIVLNDDDSDEDNEVESSSGDILVSDHNQQQQEATKSVKQHSRLIRASPPVIQQVEVPHYRPVIQQVEVPHFRPVIQQVQVPHCRPGIQQVEVPHCWPVIQQVQVPHYRPGIQQVLVPHCLPVIQQLQVPNCQPSYASTATSETHLTTACISAPKSSVTIHNNVSVNSTMITTSHLLGAQINQIIRASGNEASGSTSNVQVSDNSVNTYSQFLVSLSRGKVSQSNHNPTNVDSYPSQPAAGISSASWPPWVQTSSDQLLSAPQIPVVSHRGSRSTATRSRGRGRGIVQKEPDIPCDSQQLFSTITRGSASGRRGGRRGGGRRGGSTRGACSTQTTQLPSSSTSTSTNSLIQSTSLAISQSLPVISNLVASGIHDSNSLHASIWNIPSTSSIATQSLPNFDLMSATACGSYQSVSQLAALQRPPRLVRAPKSASYQPTLVHRANHQAPVLFPTPLQSEQAQPILLGSMTPMTTRHTNPAAKQCVNLPTTSTSTKKRPKDNANTEGMYSSVSTLPFNLASNDSNCDNAAAKSKGRRKRTGSNDKEDLKRKKNVEFVGRRIDHEWIVGSTNGARKWFTGSVLKLVTGVDGALNSRYLIKYDKEDSPYEINHLVEDYRDGSVILLS